MSRPIIWRVRVKRSIEDWVEVSADSGPRAEVEAAVIPGVISVFGKSAVRGDEIAAPVRPTGVSED